MKKLLAIILALLCLVGVVGCTSENTEAVGESSDVTDYDSSLSDNKNNYDAVCEHNIVIDPPKPASCSETGLTQGKHCSKCGEIFVSQNTVPKTNHTVVNDAAVNATCISAGKTAGSHCSVCGVVLVAQQSTATIGHNYVSGQCNKCGVKVTIKDASNTYLYLTNTIQFTDVSNGYFAFLIKSLHSEDTKGMYNQKVVGYDADGKETFSTVVETYYAGMLSSYIKCYDVPSTTTTIMISDYT